MSILKLLFKNLMGKAVTVPFPERPPMSGGYRGLVEFDPNRCTGCAMCAFRCTSRAINFRSTKTEYKWSYDPGQCTFCGRCAEGCQSEALSMQAECPPVYLSAGVLKKAYVVPRKQPAAKPAPPAPAPAATLTPEEAK